jgi:ribose transport system ATP-binding protein
MLSFAGVFKAFPGVQALDNVTFDVRAGEVHGLVGENGAGKSTLMAIAAGALLADAGKVSIDGIAVRGDPEAVRTLGLAIVRQEPTLMLDLTVAENLFLGLPRRQRPTLASINRAADLLLRQWSEEVPVAANDRVDGLDPEQRFIVEIVKAIGSDPRVLILDEPTEHLTARDTERLFAHIRAIAGRGAAVVYISHRIREVRAIADRITVLRDGQCQGTYPAASVSEGEIVRLIVGTTLSDEYPPKAEITQQGAPVLAAHSLSGPGFHNVTLALAPGEIVGLAGIVANGQREFLRALAGLNRSRGEILVGGRRITIHSPTEAVRSGITYLPGDRHVESLFGELSVRENFAARSLTLDAVAGFICSRRQFSRVHQAVSQFSIKTPSVETRVSSLSGGNQQKLMLASVLATLPRVLLVDEPTQGVDVGARAEIYRLLRSAARSGLAIMVVSSNTQEVAGLCDRVAIFSRGRVVSTLAGEEISEEAITSAILTSTGVREKGQRSARRFWNWAAGDFAPLITVALAILIMGVFATVANEYYLSTRNIGGMMVLIATLALVAYGQQALMLTGGIDLSVGPLMGLVQVVGSFFFVVGAAQGDWVLGWTLMMLTAIGLGVTNWALADVLRVHSLVATLATFMAVQAVSLLLRPQPDGLIDEAVLSALGSRFSFVPVALIVAVAAGVAMELALYRTRLGLEFRAVGSRAEAARVAGINPSRVRLMAYVCCSLFAFAAAVTMIEQVGIGDPRAGIGYTLTSIAAVVIGGGSLFGGRGSFIGALLGAVFITQVNTVTNFMGLDAAWQSYLLGTMVIAAVAFYSKSRQLAIAS